MHFGRRTMFLQIRVRKWVGARTSCRTAASVNSVAVAVIAAVSAAAAAAAAAAVLFSAHRQSDTDNERVLMYTFCTTYG